MSLKYIVLDLDGTLVHHTNFHPHKSNESYEHIILSYKDKSGCLHFRPHYKELLIWCHDVMRYEFIVFSSASEDYVTRVTDLLFKDLNFYPVHVFDSRHINIITYNKQLNWIIELLGVTKNDIVCIDDSKDNYQDHKDRILLIEEWDGYSQDNELITIRNLLLI